MAFDPKKPYCEIIGDAGDARYSQDGKLYDVAHREVKLIEQRVRDDAGVVSVVVSTELVESKRAKKADPQPETVEPGAFD